MVKDTKRRVFDLHCDTLTECGKRQVGLLSDKLPHFSLDRLPADMPWCQCMAVFIPDELCGADARQYFDRICACYRRETQLHKERLLPVENLSAVAQALEQAPVATILTVEGGAVLAGRLKALAELYELGVRMITLTWNAENELAGGVETDTGFTPLGRRAVAEMERLGIAVDVSHLSDRAFWELCDFARRPFAASHSNARAVCGHRRNLTDDMFRQIVERGGVVGLNYSQYFLRDGGNSNGIDDLLRHMHHFLELGGEDTLALGSDYDGTDIPATLDRPDKIGNLIEAMERSGIPSTVVDKILFDNACRFFGVVGGEDA